MQWLAEHNEKAKKVPSPPWLELERAAGPFSATVCAASMAVLVGRRFWKEGEGCTIIFDLTCSSKCGLLLLKEAQFLWTQFLNSQGSIFGQSPALIIHGLNAIFLLLLADEKFYQWDPGGGSTFFGSSILFL
ncbi:hypothetical protein PIB30_039882 [Stylosanthes scabra]|uniref:Uncharacterized protein n=1 Tax=Stylosanthes scabra TaxID=79078 RepID=A0ABU6WEG3_9FABA|nr:hypothetical protein [Stylosanthes scabra]